MLRKWEREVQGVWCSPPTIHTSRHLLCWWCLTKTQTWRSGTQVWMENVYKQLAGPPLHPAIGRAAQFLGSLESGNVPTCLASRWGSLGDVKCEQLLISYHLHCRWWGSPDVVSCNMWTRFEMLHCRRLMRTRCSSPTAATTCLTTSLWFGEVFR